MELECSGVKGGWMSIAYLDMTKGGFSPYPGSRIAMPGIFKHVRKSPIPGGCHSVNYSTQGVVYNKICGQVSGYQRGSPEAFIFADWHNKSIDSFSIWMEYRYNYNVWYSL